MLYETLPLVISVEKEMMDDVLAYMGDGAADITG
jgi:hypothetical protein